MEPLLSTERTSSEGFLHTIIHKELGLRGYLAIDSTVNGIFSGGVRMAADVSPGEIIQLARIMTLKYGFLGLPVGGAKAGIAADPAMPGEKKKLMLEAFGRAIEPFLKEGHYYPGTDLGTTAEDVASILRGAGIKRIGQRASTASERFTGLSLAATAVEAARFRGLPATGLSLTIVGFGKVGTSAAREASAMGFRLIGISTIRGARYNPSGFDVPALLEIYRREGDNVVRVSREGVRIEKEALLEASVDVLSPCAGMRSIHRANVGNIRAKVVSPGANIAVDDEAERILYERGVLYIPDFVANCGGVLAANMEPAGLDNEFIRNFINTRLIPKLRFLLEQAALSETSLGGPARQAAIEGFQAAKKRAERWRFFMRFLGPADSLYRKGLIPRSLVRSFSRRYYEKNVLVSPGLSGISST
jgi:glutamate dehydrogenase (NAD(P)+)